MSRKFIATIVAAAITVTGISAVPARADEDVIKFILGAAAIYALTQAIEDRNEPRVSTTSPYRPRTVEPRPLPRRARRLAPIPARCLKHHETQNGMVRMIGKRCVNRHYHQAHRLPETCRVSRHTYNGVRHGYKPRCLRRNGFEVARH
ncbi:hypothetical protein SAMN05444000_11677 [Shimia gijangensis]|uniref:Uncharacterized protein n=1 Tax=Shimia gijangensis TaxID=1470563 RepID=A0A1M6NR42_9RHOB|nr:hypothetical protein [Shimia gijangensis]SHJ98128.1 hypothetical protein SAMN05444000_11677 [Shimia gijangensis]